MSAGRSTQRSSGLKIASCDFSQTFGIKQEARRIDCIAPDVEKATPANIGPVAHVLLVYQPFPPGVMEPSWSQLVGRQAGGASCRHRKVQSTSKTGRRNLVRLRNWSLSNMENLMKSRQRSSSGTAQVGRESVPYYAAYTASKHGVVGLCDALRQEVRQAGLEDIHVCAIMPTAHDTPFFDHVANYSGHQVEPPTPLHDPENVVEAIVAAARDPGDENIVGWDGTIKIAMKRLLPSAADAAMAWTMHKTQMDGPPASNTSGAVNSPIEEGTEVDVGRRTRR